MLTYVKNTLNTAILTIWPETFKNDMFLTKYILSIFTCFVFLGKFYLVVRRPMLYFNNIRCGPLILTRIFNIVKASRPSHGLLSHRKDFSAIAQTSQPSQRLLNHRKDLEDG